MKILYLGGRSRTVSGQGFKAILSYVVSFRLALGTRNTVSKKKNKIWGWIRVLAVNQEDLSSDLQYPHTQLQEAVRCVLGRRGRQHGDMLTGTTDLPINLQYSIISELQVK